MDWEVEREDITAFQEFILQFYEEHGRDFPWRDTDNDLHALVAEIMLQQTSYYQVEPAYLDFVDTYETPEDVIAADQDELRSFFDGLGLANRAEYVQAAARSLASTQDLNQEDLLGTKGIGRYTANAFLSIHKGERYPIVDGNIKRAIETYFGFEVDETPSQCDPLWELMWVLLPTDHIKEYQLGLLDYGASLYEGNPHT